MRENKVPLTEEQRQLAEANVGLVFATVHKMARRFPSVRKIEDQALTEGFLALVKATRSFDPEKGTFQKYACASIWVEVSRRVRRWFRVGLKPLPRDVVAEEHEATQHSDAYEMARLWLDRVPADEIGEMFGVKAVTIGARCRKLGLPPRVKRLSEKRMQRLFKSMWERGDSVADIARVLGVRPHSVHNRRIRMGLTPRPMYFRSPTT